MSVHRFHNRRVEILLDEKENMFIKALAKHDDTTEKKLMTVLLDLKIKETMKTYKDKEFWYSENEFDFLLDEKEK